MLNTDDLDVDFHLGEMLILATLLAAYLGIGVLIGWWVWA